jgi:hypothetical protein
MRPRGDVEMNDAGSHCGIIPKPTAAVTRVVVKAY